MSRQKVFHSAMTNRWYLASKMRRDGSVASKIDITDTLNAILTPASDRIKALEKANEKLLAACKAAEPLLVGALAFVDCNKQLNQLREAVKSAKEST